MGLIHWWPLNGNLNDKGTSNVSLTNNGATVNSAGKIGSCYSFNGSSTYLRAEYPNTTKPGILSIAGWYKPTSIASGKHHYILNCYESGGAGLSTNDTASIKMQIYCNGAYSSTAASIPDTNWHHWCGTFDGRYIKLYRDGSLQSTKDLGTTYSISYEASTPWMIGANPNPSGVATGNFTDGLINDVRIYDHALSVKEVKEISKGLMVHYTFEDDSNVSPNIFDIDNYLGSSHYMNTGTKATYSSSGFTITSTGTDMFIEGICYSLGATANSGWHLMPVQEGKTYRISYDLVYGPNLSKSLFSYFNSSRVCVGASAYTGFTFSRRGTTNTYYYDFTVPTGYSITSISFRLGYASSAGEVITAEHWQLRNVTDFIDYSPANFSTSFTMYDSSGYGNNGTINNGASIMSGSPSGKYAINLPLNSTITNTSRAFDKTELTYSIWFRHHGKNGSTSTYMFTNGRADMGGWGYGISIDSDSQISCRYGNSTKAITNCSKDAWHLITVSIKDAAQTIYFDGILAGSSTASTVPTYSDGSGLGLGCFYYNGGSIYYSNCDFADFKIYATALSEADAKAEYNRKAAIDKVGNLFTGEVVATNTSLRYPAMNTTNFTGATFIANNSIIQVSGHWAGFQYANALFTLNKFYHLSFDAKYVSGTFLNILGHMSNFSPVYWFIDGKKGNTGWSNAPANAVTEEQVMLDNKWHHFDLYIKYAAQNDSYGPWVQVNRTDTSGSATCQFTNLGMEEISSISYEAAKLPTKVNTVECYNIIEGYSAVKIGHNGTIQVNEIKEL